MDEHKSHLLKGVTSYLIHLAAVEMTKNLKTVSKVERTLSGYHSSKDPSKKGSNESAL